MTSPPGVPPARSSAESEARGEAVLPEAARVVEEVDREEAAVALEHPVAAADVVAEALAHAPAAGEAERPALVEPRHDTVDVPAAGATSRVEVVQHAQPAVDRHRNLRCPTGEPARRLARGLLRPRSLT